MLGRTTKNMIFCVAEYNFYVSEKNTNNYLKSLLGSQQTEKIEQKSS